MAGEGGGKVGKITVTVVHKKQAGLKVRPGSKEICVETLFPNSDHTGGASATNYEQSQSQPARACDQR